MGGGGDGRGRRRLEQINKMHATEKEKVAFMEADFLQLKNTFFDDTEEEEDTTSTEYYYNLYLLEKETKGTFASQNKL